MDEFSNVQTQLKEEGVQTMETVGKTQTEKGFELSEKAYKFFHFFPYIVFAVFAVLMVVCMALLPVANVRAFGLNEKYGSIFSAERFGEIAGLNALSVALLVFAFVTVVYAVVMLQHKLTSFRYRKAFGKPIFKFLEVISLAFLLGYVVLTIVLMGAIHEADEGVKIIRVGAFPVLTMILSVVCLVSITISIVLCHLHEKAHPEILANWKEERQKAIEESKTPEGRAKKAARNAKQKVSKKIVAFVAPLVAVVLVLSFANLSDFVARFQAKPFDANDLKELLLKDDDTLGLYRTTVETEVGSPYVADGASAEDNNEVYYTNAYSELLKKAERNQKYLALAIEQGDYRISALLQQARNLQMESEVLAYGKAEITYSEQGEVQNAVYNNVVIDGMPSIAKKLDTVQIFRVVEKLDTDTVRRVESVRYIATYVDGSFIYGTCKSVAVVLEDGTTSATYEGSYVGKTLKWQDEFGEYEVVASANK